MNVHVTMAIVVKVNMPMSLCTKKVSSLGVDFLNLMEFVSFKSKRSVKIYNRKYLSGIRSSLGHASRLIPTRTPWSNLHFKTRLIQIFMKFVIDYSCFPELLLSETRCLLVHSPGERKFEASDWSN